MDHNMLTRLQKADSWVTQQSYQYSCTIFRGSISVIHSIYLHTVHFDWYNNTYSFSTRYSVVAVVLDIVVNRRWRELVVLRRSFEVY